MDNNKCGEFYPQGPYAALLTPYTVEGKINEATLRDEVEFLASSNITGIFPCGSSGEFIHLSTEENCRIMDIVADQLKGRKIILPGTCSSNVDTTVQLIKKAEEVGCPAVVICPPYYITLSQEEILEYYRILARRVKTAKIILYNIPMFTNEISMTIFRELLKEKSIIAIKDSSANMKRISHYIDIVRNERQDFAVMTGTDDILFPALVSGCVGSMTAFSGILPEITTGIYEAFYNQEYSTALQLQQSIMKLLRCADSLAFPAGYKMIMEKRGLSMGPSKQVIPQMGTDQYKEMEREMEMELFKILGKNVKVKG